MSVRNSWHFKKRWGYYSVKLGLMTTSQVSRAKRCASRVARKPKLAKDFLFSDLGETELRGFEHPVKLWELRWREDS